MKLTNFTKIFTCQFQAEPSPIDCLFISMPILFTTQSGHSDQLRLSPHTQKMKDSDFTCSNHQEFTTDTHAVLQAKAVKQPRPNSKRQTSQNLPARRLFSTLPRCNFWLNLVWPWLMKKQDKRNTNLNWVGSAKRADSYTKWSPKNSLKKQRKRLWLQSNNKKWDDCFIHLFFEVLIFYSLV